MENNEKQSTNNDLYAATLVKVPNARFFYCKLDQPEMSQSGKPKYSCCVVIEKKDTEAKGLIEQGITAARDLAVQRLWGGKIPANLNLPVQDGDQPDSSGDIKPHFVGKYKMNASSYKPVKIFDKARKELQGTGEFRSGDYGVALLRFKAYDRNGNRGIACYLEGILKTRDSDGAVDAEAEFSDLFDKEAGTGDAAAKSFLGF